MALQARIAAVVDESVRLTKTLPDHVVDERTAARTGADCYATWQRLQALINDWEAGHELNRTMQSANWLDGPVHATDRTFVWTFQAYRLSHRLPTIKARCRRSSTWRRPWPLAPSPACIRGPMRRPGRGLWTGASTDQWRC